MKLASILTYLLLLLFLHIAQPGPPYLTITDDTELPSDLSHNPDYSMLLLFCHPTASTACHRMLEIWAQLRYHLDPLTQGKSFDIAYANM